MHFIKNERSKLKRIENMCNSLINPDKMHIAILTENVRWSQKIAVFHLMKHRKKEEWEREGEEWGTKTCSPDAYISITMTKRTAKKTAREIYASEFKTLEILRLHQREHTEQEHYTQLQSTGKKPPRKCWTNNSFVNEKANTHFRPFAKSVEKRMFV